VTPRMLLRSANTALLILLSAVGQLHVSASEFPGKGVPLGVAGCAVTIEDEMRDRRAGNRTPPHPSRSVDSDICYMLKTPAFRNKW